MGGWRKESGENTLSQNTMKDIPFGLKHLLGRGLDIVAMPKRALDHSEDVDGAK